MCEKERERRAADFTRDAMTHSFVSQKGLAIAFHGATGPKMQRKDPKKVALDPDKAGRKVAKNAHYAFPA